MLTTITNTLSDIEDRTNIVFTHWFVKPLIEGSPAKMHFTLSGINHLLSFAGLITKLLLKEGPCYDPHISTYNSRYTLSYESILRIIYMRYTK